MTYFCCKWKHNYPDEPILLYSELDDERWETRKVEIYADNRQHYADASESFGSSMLSAVPIPTLEEINAQPEFEAREINREEFETVWKSRTGIYDSGQI